MGKVHVSAFSITLDGFSAGPDQSLNNPLGVGGVEMMEWMFPTKMFAEMQGKVGGETGVDNDFAVKSMTGNGAWILGRNMFGPVRGPWPDDNWKGWWGDEPPYYVPTFVLTHYPRDPIEMKGGTTFYFVTDGIHSVLEKAKQAAGDKDIRIGGGPATVRQYLKERLIDELHLAMRPIFLGKGETIFKGVNFRELGYCVEETVPGERATHLIVRKQN
ncbi:MAG: dihydrofolate reductase family protein [Pyrinomonadaceae bacterium]